MSVPALVSVPVPVPAPVSVPALVSVPVPVPVSVPVPVPVSVSVPAPVSVSVSVTFSGPTTSETSTILPFSSTIFTPELLKSITDVAPVSLSCMDANIVAAAAPSSPGSVTSGMPNVSLACSLIICSIVPWFSTSPVAALPDAISATLPISMSIAGMPVCMPVVVPAGVVPIFPNTPPEGFPHVTVPVATVPGTAFGCQTPKSGLPMPIRSNIGPSTLSKTLPTALPAVLTAALTAPVIPPPGIFKPRDSISALRASNSCCFSSAVHTLPEVAVDLPNVWL